MLDLRRLQRQWRRVASTHDLEELLKDESEVKRRSKWKLLLYGCLLVCAAFLFVSYEVYALYISKSVHASDSWIRNDRYYCLLIPLLIPMFLYTVILNWFFLKLYKHNS